MAAKRLTIEQQRAMRRRLNDAAESLAIYLDPEDGDCAVPAAAREVSEEYLYTWVMTQIEGALITLNNALDGS
jgi:hypothetical protein